MVENTSTNKVADKTSRMYNDFLQPLLKDLNAKKSPQQIKLKYTAL
ncbi:hypothetical protein FHS11_000977 [Mucilaginibacter gotjawali]|uniref:Uncharacterized protein n=1 Tax=Mucilaginibacter gotjawali TaxID=1550579 RepID=A0A839SDD0_9SPHI|nr:hypothetical protein [Mucilaginibacter gotjawali]